MPRTNSAETFIRLLTEAYETDRMNKKAKRSAHQKTKVAKFKEKQVAVMSRLRDAMEPMDCVQLAVAEARDRRLT